jgi:prepilin-type N-terminal cleavage/methylation domain-containing protein
VRWRPLRGEGGFTLPEVLVTMVMMTTILFALYSIFDMGIRVFSFGNDKVEAVENARLGLEKMARELRAAYPYDKIKDTPTDTSLPHLFWNSGYPATAAFPASSSITFGNDRNGNRKIETDSEQITYSLSGGSPATLLRNGQPVVEFVKDVDGDGTALGFRFFDANGNEILTNEEAKIAIVRIKLEIAVNRGGRSGPVTQVLQTDVALRNRAG